MMPWFPSDFLGATRGWPLTARAIYRELLDAQWDMGVLPIATILLQQIVGATPEQWQEGWPFVEAKFPAIEGGRRNPTLEEHRIKALKLKEKRAEVGRKGGLAKAVAIAKPIAVPIALAKVYHPSPSPSPSDTSQSLVSEIRPTARASRSPATYMPEDFQMTPEREQYARDQKLINPARTFQNFYDYWIGKSGAQGKHRDWDRAWQRWCRIEADRQQPLANRSTKTKFEQMMEKIDAQT